MKRLEITYVADDYGKLEAVLDEAKLIHFKHVVNIGGKMGRVYFALVPDDLIDKVIGDVSAVLDLRYKEVTISSISVEGIVSPHLEAFKKKLAEKRPHSNPLERLVEETDRYTRVDYDVVLITVFTALIALFGLYLNNVIILIGAMLLSPLLGPINAFSVNGSLGQLTKMLRSQISLGVLVLTVVLVSFLGSQLIDLAMLTPLEMTTLIALSGDANLIDLIIAVILGLASGLALFVALPDMLIGVAVAVALVPPTAVIGIGLAISNATLVINSILKTLVNIIGLELGGVVVLRLKGVFPRRYYEKSKITHRTLYSILSLITLVVLMGIIIFLIQ